MYTDFFLHSYTLICESFISKPHIKSYYIQIVSACVCIHVLINLS